MVSAPSMNMTPHSATQDELSRGARLVRADGQALPLQAAHLSVDAKGGLARVVLTQTFANPTSETLNVQYLLPLPADGAVSGFSFTVAGERVVGEVQGKQLARERYEAALIQGRTAALLEQTRTSLFSQSVGNLPPHETLTAEIVVDQPLRWLEEAGAWQWRFPTVVGPRYSGAPGRVADAGQLVVPMSAEPLAVRMGLELLIRDPLSEGHQPSSPSHTLHVHSSGGTRVRLSEEGGARLDRDVVVHWPVAALAPGATLDVVRPAAAAHRGEAYGLLTLVPPAPGAAWTPVARDLVVLIDTSGSMGGEPLAQAKRVISALIDTLGPKDRVELISFDYAPTRFRPEPIAATPDGKRAALAWIRELSAGGGTEMHAAVQEALRPLRAGAQRQVVLVTDGYIGFEREIVEQVRTALPASCRLHTVGVGSSVNRSLTEAAARAGAGVEVIIAPGEDPERAAQRLVARTDRPVVTELVVEGEGVLGFAPVHLPDLFANTPAQVCLRLSGAGGQVRLRARTHDGELVQTLKYPALALGDGAGQVAVRFARERVADLEAHKAGGGDTREIDGEIEKLGVDFQIATRLTSWVAVSQAVTVTPGRQARTVTQPQEVPQDVSLAGLGLRTAAASLGMVGGAASPVSRSAAMPRPVKSKKRARPVDEGARGRIAPPPPQALSELADLDDEALSVEREEAADAFQVTEAWGGNAAKEEAPEPVASSAGRADEAEADKAVDPLPLRRAPVAPPPAAAPAPLPAVPLGAGGRRAGSPPPPASEEPTSAPPAAEAPKPEPEPAAEVEQAQLPASMAGASKPEAEPSTVEPVKARRGRRAGLWTLLVLVAALLAALWWWLRPASQGASEPEPSESAAPAAAPKSGTER